MFGIECANQRSIASLASKLDQLFTGYGELDSVDAASDRGVPFTPFDSDLAAFLGAPGGDPVAKKRGAVSRIVDAALLGRCLQMQGVLKEPYDL